jgi:hypothetical protein
VECGSIELRHIAANDGDLPALLSKEERRVPASRVKG